MEAYGPVWPDGPLQFQNTATIQVGIGFIETKLGYLPCLPNPVTGYKIFVGNHTWQALDETSVGQEKFLYLLNMKHSLKAEVGLQIVISLFKLLNRFYFLFLIETRNFKD